MPHPLVLAPLVLDLSHLDGDVDFGLMKGAGIVGVILKATQGSSEVDPAFHDRYPRALEVFGAGCVGCYHFLDGTNPIAQFGHFYKVVKGLGLWTALDYEQNKESQCNLNQAVAVTHMLQAKQDYWPVIYGSERDILGTAISQGHFGPCPKWLAKYAEEPPSRDWTLWQYSETGTIPGAGSGTVDLNAFNGSADECVAWMKSLTAPAKA